MNDQNTPQVQQSTAIGGLLKRSVSRRASVNPPVIELPSKRLSAFQGVRQRETGRGKDEGGDAVGQYRCLP